jgi:ribosome-associated heat shock protein Hsp15
MTRRATGPAPLPSIRIDKWLWYARVFKSRTQATTFVSKGKVRVNRQRVTKPGAPVRIGDVLTFVRNQGVRIYRVAALGERRGTAPEAQALYEDLVSLDDHGNSGEN